MVLFLLGLINFAAFAYGTKVVGGRATALGPQDGRYYVALSHGKYAEVSAAAWQYSAIHSASVFITHPLGMFGVILMIWANHRKRQLLAKG